MASIIFKIFLQHIYTNSHPYLYHNNQKYPLRKKNSKEESLYSTSVLVVLDGLCYTKQVVNQLFSKSSKHTLYNQHLVKSADQPARL